MARSTLGTIRPRVLRAKRMILVIAFLASAAWAAVLLPSSRASTDGVPKASSALYVGSSACAGCHPGEHASFRATFHRTMTQAAEDATVLAPFERRGRNVFADGARIVLTTGSHRQQAYWVKGERPGDLRLLPSVWLVREQRLIPRKEAFLTPPDRDLGRVRWSSSCIACHAVAGEPRHDMATDGFATEVGELGVTCEACHGPGAAHVERHRDPFERHAARGRESDPSIVHPARLAPERSAAICGQCHSYAFPRDEREWWSHGYSLRFRAGDALEPSRYLLGPGTEAASVEATEESLFWSDGTIRVGGREYNGMVLSPCFERGTGERKLTCLSCHAMHEGNPAGQIAPRKIGNAACNPCHVETKEHSHHALGSPGRECAACHMPKTSYALLAAVRSHRIESPHVDADKPNACNLCHLERSEAWTAGRLEEWFGKKPAEASEVPYGARAALSGDAAVRVLVADALGTTEATASPGFRAQLLGELARDPYAAVRFVAQRRSFTGVPPIDPALVKRLLEARDDRPVSIAE